MKKSYNVDLKRPTEYKKEVSHIKIYFCPTCRRAWQPVVEQGKTHIEYFPKWIAGDEDKQCKECEEIN